MCGRACWFALALAMVAAMLPPAPASAASILELNFWLSGPRYDGALPPCDAPAALDTIAFRFTQKEGRFWNSALTIQGYERIRETAYRPWAPNTIPRRFCSALAEHTATANPIRDQRHAARISVSPVPRQRL